MSMRIGYGWDSHAFKTGVPLKIGGLLIDHPKGLCGHSDGDVLLHAITDALLGAVAAGDIGSFFPPGDPRWKDANSAIFLNLAIEEVRTAGYQLVNVDSTLVLSEPKISPIAHDLRESVSALLHIPPGAVGIKAKTPEGLNQDHLAVAHAIVLLERIEGEDGFRQMEATVESDETVDDVVSELVREAHGAGAAHRKSGFPPFDTDDIT
jgi:2-C-methyl-D-erythritol 2,4-cyclodiphosphate synthase